MFIFQPQLICINYFNFQIFRLRQSLEVEGFLDGRVSIIFFLEDVDNFNVLLKLTEIGFSSANKGKSLALCQ